MFLVAIIGVPIVLTCTTTVYHVFRGKVVLTEESYEAGCPRIRVKNSR